MPSTKNRQRIGYRRIVQLLVYLVIIPTVLLLSLGIVLMFIGQAGFNLLLGILTVSFVAVVTTGVILVLVFVRREANLSELQADFVSKVSHELRTPLTASASSPRRSSAQGRPEDARRVRRCSRRETERLSRHIERLLDWGRMEAGRKLYDLKRDERVPTSSKSAADAFAPLRTDAAARLRGAGRRRISPRCSSIAARSSTRS